MQKSNLVGVVVMLLGFIALSLYMHYHSLHDTGHVTTSHPTATSNPHLTPNEVHPLREAHPHHWQALMNWLKHSEESFTILKLYDEVHSNNDTTSSHRPIRHDVAERDKQRIPGSIHQFLHPSTTSQDKTVDPSTIKAVKPPGTFSSTEALQKFKDRFNKPYEEPPPDPPSDKKIKFHQKPDKPAPQAATLPDPAPMVKQDIVSASRLMEECHNQTVCLQPELQLEPFYNVYYCKHVSYGIRFYYLIREGLLLHPKIRLVDDPDSADIIIYLPESANWKKTECNAPKYWSKTIMLDEGDHQGVFIPDEFRQTSPPSSFLMMFKRSYVRRSNGAFGGYMGYMTTPNLFPMTYTVADAYVRTRYKPFTKRQIDILCTLRGSNWDPVRQRIREWVEEYGKARNLPKVVAGQINSASRQVVSKQYFENMYNAQIIVTSNPSDWEGDFRFCEALASGAMIFIDHMYVPRPKPFIEHKHVVYYSNQNKTDLFEKLDQYLLPTTSQMTKDQLFKQRQQIALRGYIHAMRYHRAANLIDYVFRTLHTYQIALKDGKSDQLATNEEYLKSIGKYKETGYDLRFYSMKRQKQFEKEKKEGGKMHFH